jgi:very-short-patch-repair endonuclease
VLVDRGTYDAVLARHAGSRLAALLQQGLVEVGDRRDAARPETPVTSPTTALDVVADAGDDAARVLRVRAELALRPEDPEIGERARSLAEQLLYDALEARASTRARFVLNREMAFLFGPRACEIDLCDLEARIAIEVDGYHHFASYDAYRRDRRKDLLLQREGFLVLRFLACDIFDRLAIVVDAIEDSLYHRQPDQR